MSKPRWRKVARDIWAGRGRMALMVVAMASSLFALGTALGSFAALSRGVTGSYLKTHPASATIEMDSVDSSLVQRVRSQPGIREAEARATLRARVRVGDDWRPLLLFVVPDFTDMRLSTFKWLEGDWPPPRGTMLVDHMTLPIVNARMGEGVVVKTPRGVPTRVGVSGVVWDSSLAPAGMERTGWGYITPETLALLGESGELDELKIMVTDNDPDTAAIERTARHLVGWLKDQGHAVREIQIPPPGKHPHQGQMNAVMLMLNIFALFALLLSGVLVGTTVASMMARQIREIGVMKAVGAGNGQIARLYLGMMLVLGLGGLIPSVPLAVVASRALVRMAAYNLNIQLESLSIP